MGVCASFSCLPRPPSTDLGNSCWWPDWLARKQLSGLSRATQYLPELCHSHLPPASPGTGTPGGVPCPRQLRIRLKGAGGGPPTPSKHLVASLTCIFVSLIPLWLFQIRKLQGAGPLPLAEVGAQADPWALWSRFLDSFTAQETEGPAAGRLPLALNCLPAPQWETGLVSTHCRRLARLAQG